MPFRPRAYFKHLSSIAARMSGHSQLPKKFTRSRSTAITGSIEPCNASSSTTPRQWHMASHAPGTPTAHWCAFWNFRRHSLLYLCVYLLAKEDRMNSPIWMGRGLPFFFLCQQRRVLVSHRALGGSARRRTAACTLSNARRSPLVSEARGTFSISMICSGRVPVGPGPVSLPYLTPCSGDVALEGASSSSPRLSSTFSEPGLAEEAEAAGSLIAVVGRALRGISSFAKRKSSSALKCKRDEVALAVAFR